jgi:hypothetical protein
MESFSARVWSGAVFPDAGIAEVLMRLGFAGLVASEIMLAMSSRLSDRQISGEPGDFKPRRPLRRHSQA